MGFFKKLFKSGKDKEEKDFSFILEIAKLISDNDDKIIRNLAECAYDPWGYGEENAERYMERGIDVPGEDNTNADEICWIGMIDELEENRYLIGVDYKCELNDFLWALKQLKSYSLIEPYISSMNLNENNDVEAWGEEINLVLNGKAYVCMIDIDSDSYELIIVSGNIYEKISEIAESNNHEIESF